MLLIFKWRFATPLNTDLKSVVTGRSLPSSKSSLDKDGVLVQNMVKGAAKNAGVQLGDVILRLDNQVVHDAASFEKIVKNLPTGKSIAALIQRRGSPAFLALKIDK